MTKEAGMDFKLGIADLILVYVAVLVSLVAFGILPS